MKIYYKGELCKIVNANCDSVGIGFGLIQRFNSFDNSFLDLDFSSKALNIIESFLRKTRIKNTIDVSSELGEIFDEKLKNMPVNVTTIYDIIYEEIIASDGNRYGKEFHSGLVFPIFTFLERKNQYTIELEKIAYVSGVFFLLNIIPSFEIAGLLKIGTVISNRKIADNNEIIEYQNKFNKGLNRKRSKRYFIEDMKELYNMNVFKYAIEEGKPKMMVREEPSKETSIMENIEYLLQKLEKCNKELYNQFNSQYETILNTNTTLTLTPLSIESLSVLESKIEWSLFIDKKGSSNILEYIDKLKREYLNNMLTQSSNKTSLTLFELDRICQLFLKNKSEYSVLEQRKVMKSLAFLYLMEVKENINSITGEELNNSYFQILLKSIIINIRALSNLGIINDDLIIDMSNELTCESVLELIRRMEFKKTEDEKVKQLIIKL